VKYTHAIPRDRFGDCPHCGKSSWHQCMIYMDHETNKCKNCGKEWQVKFSQFGEEYDKEIRVSRDRIKELVTGLAASIRVHKWSKNQAVKDKEMVEYAIRSLLTISAKLDGLVISPTDDNDEHLEVATSKTVSARSTDYPWEVRRTYNERLFEGVRFFAEADLSDAKTLAKSVRSIFKIDCITRVLSESNDYPTRIIVMLPRDPENSLEDAEINSARDYIKKWGE
jgi:hypothetical protein